MIRKINAQCPETAVVLFHFQQHQPWEEKMGLLMLLLVVMAANSHLEGTRGSFSDHKLLSSGRQVAHCAQAKCWGINFFFFFFDSRWSSFMLISFYVCLFCFI